jgi:hypothetical protein
MRNEDHGFAKSLLFNEISVSPPREGGFRKNAAIAPGAGLQKMVVLRKLYLLFTKNHHKKLDEKWVGWKKWKNSIGFFEKLFLSVFLGFTYQIHLCFNFPPSLRQSLAVVR